jgi:UTP-glucose-1-phosphate uridylyltransferase
MLQAIIPAAGLGTRMLPFSGITAKELAPLGTKPVIQLTLEEAELVGVSAVTVVISPRKKELERFLNGDLPKEILAKPQIAEWLELLGKLKITIAYQKEPKGLGDAFLHGRDAAPAEHYYLMYPDNLITDPAKLFAALHQPFQASGKSIVATMADRDYWQGNHYIYPGPAEAGAYAAAKATRRDDPLPAPGEEHYRGCGRALITTEYLEILEEVRSSGIAEELDDIHAYQQLIQRGKLLCTPPSCDIHDGGDLVGYRDAWTAYLAGEFKQH